MKRLLNITPFASFIVLVTFVTWKGCENVHFLLYCPIKKRSTESFVCFDPLTIHLSEAGKQKNKKKPTQQQHQPKKFINDSVFKKQ